MTTREAIASKNLTNVCFPKISLLPCPFSRSLDRVCSDTESEAEGSTSKEEERKGEEEV